MPNEFEKQVQQMMDELKLVPSEPVWQKVELQIRKKKDRRRLIFWLPLLALLLGGGLWIGMSQYSNKISYRENNNVTGKEINKATDKNLPLTNTTEPIEQKSPEHIAKIKNSDKPRNEKIKEEPEARSTHISLGMKPNTKMDVSKKASQAKDEMLENEKEIQVKPKEAELNKMTETVVVNQSSIEKVLKEAVPNLAIQVSTDTTNAIFLKKKIETNSSIIDSIKQDNTSLKPEVQKQDTSAGKKANIKKYATSKWKLNLVATGGSSDISDVSLFEGLFGNGEKSLAAPNYSGGSATGGFPTYYGPSDIKEGFSFAVGALAKKQLAKKIFFSTGLRYNYYSNAIQVGNKINQNRVLMDFSVSQYYSNTGTSLRPYHNRYHFASLPLAIDWQLLKKVPLNFYTGLSMQYLIKTNGLVFDYTTQSYFNSKDAFNRIQLFFEPALTYSVSIRKKVLTFGPQLQYAFSRLEKNNSTYHLTSYGLKAQLQFGKK